MFELGNLFRWQTTSSVVTDNNVIMRIIIH